LMLLHWVGSLSVLKGIMTLSARNIGQ